jgi:hypothetical protein
MKESVAEAPRPISEPPEHIPRLSDDDSIDAKPESNIERVSARRNIERVDLANSQDASLLGKYLPSSVDAFLPGTLHGPDDSFTAPDWLFQAVKSVAHAEVKTPEAPPVRFDTSPESLQFNSDLLQGFDFDFEQFLATQGSTTLGFGSEF